MELVHVTIEQGGTAMVSLHQGKVNAIDEPMVDELSQALTGLEKDDNVKLVVLTGSHKFFSFGFDIPQFMSYDRSAFTSFLIKFTRLYQNLFVFPKPVIAAINGHCIAAGAMLACACDYRIMVAGRAKIGINELGFGSTVFAGTVEMLQYVVGTRNARKILYSADLLSAADAMTLGLVDKVTTSIDMTGELARLARQFTGRDPRAFASIKSLMRRTAHETMVQRESHSIHQFVDIWYSGETRERLAAITIHD